MNTVDTINTRRSIRKFQDKAIPSEVLKIILSLATKAPSGKNRQPWRYCVLQNKSKNELVQIMKQTVETRSLYGQDIGSCLISIQAMTEAPAVVLVFNPYSKRKTHIITIDCLQIHSPLVPVFKPLYWLQIALT